MTSKFKTWLRASEYLCPQPDCQIPQMSPSHGASLGRSDDSKLEQCTSKCQQTVGFSWVGSAWTCKKKRNHYESFRRNGVRISVHDFVFVLAEEDNRLVAYLSDMYEDSKGNKMVVVQWFHNIDEIGVALLTNYSDREIFFSLCVQDLSIECIDGLATVLSPQHYETLLSKSTAIHLTMELFICHRQFHNEDVGPFDITQVDGYWKQEVVKYIYSSSETCFKSQQSKDGIELGCNYDDSVGIKSKKRLRHSKDIGMYLCSVNRQNECDLCSKAEDLCSCIDLEDGLRSKDALLQKSYQKFNIGSQIEVLSQDSGIRGCWFKAQIIKKRRDKVKVRYEDIKDADDETANLEEWILASKVAVPDQLGIRLCGRTIIRPVPMSNNNIGMHIKAGSVVDAWWHDGWWEGIVVLKERKESEDVIHVYFPGEKQRTSFSSAELRISEEWLGDRWEPIKGCLELMVSVHSDLKAGDSISQFKDLATNQNAVHDSEDLKGSTRDRLSRKNPVENWDTGVVLDPSEDNLLAHLKWNWSRKRRHVRNYSQKRHSSVSEEEESLEELKSKFCSSFCIQPSLKIDHDNCSVRDASLFSSPMVSALASLVMSR